MEGINREKNYKRKKVDKMQNVQFAGGASAGVASPRKKRAQKKKFSLKNVFNVGRKGLDMPLFTLVLILLSIGLIMLFSASYPTGYVYGDSYSFIRDQAVFAVMGLGIMFAVSIVDYHQIRNLSKLIFGVTVGFLLITIIFAGTPIAPREGVASRWINLGFVSFQPSEFAKFALVLVLAKHISKVGDKVKTFSKGVLPCFGFTAIIAGLVLLERHLSATIIILLVAGIIMFVGGIRARWFIGIFGIVLVGIIIVVASGAFDYALSRLDTWLDPFSDYQTKNSLYAIGSGQLLGVGLGQSTQKHLYLPAPQNDFIFAIVCEELGFIGAIIIIALFVALIWRGVSISIHAKDMFGMLLGLGITFIIGIQTVLNICVVTAAIPNTGISLPFFSAGGTSLVTLLAEIGVLLSISKDSYIEKT